MAMAAARKKRDKRSIEPPDEIVWGVCIPKTNGITWWTPDATPTGLRIAYKVVAFLQTALIFVYPTLLLRRCGLVQGLLRLPLIVPLGLFLDENFGPNYGTAYCTLQSVFAATVVVQASAAPDEFSYLGLALMVVAAAYGFGSVMCFTEFTMGRGLFHGLLVFVQILLWLATGRSKVPRNVVLAVLLAALGIALVQALGSRAEARKAARKAAADAKDRTRALERKRAELKQKIDKCKKDVQRLSEAAGVCAIEEEVLQAEAEAVARECVNDR